MSQGPRHNKDAVRRLLDVTNGLIDDGQSAPGDVMGALDALAGLSPRDLVRFDEQSRSLYSGLGWSELGDIRSSALWMVLVLVSRDGYDRERAVRAAPFTLLTIRLVVLRTIDWAP